MLPANSATSSSGPKTPSHSPPSPPRWTVTSSAFALPDTDTDTDSDDEPEFLEARRSAVLGGSAPVINFAPLQEAPPNGPGIVELLRRVGFTLEDLPNYNGGFVYTSVNAWLSRDPTVNAAQVLAMVCQKLVNAELAKWRKEQKLIEERNRNADRATRSKTKANTEVRLRGGRFYIRDSASPKPKPKDCLNGPARKPKSSAASRRRP
ncbi:hypothetical protein OC844_006400 [Tilletia horrida]|nr:hypothetical protein OC844_006400 [Tilletia horrida]